MKKEVYIIIDRIVLAGVLLLLIGSLLPAQEKELHIDIYRNGNMLMVDELEIAFIYGNEPLGFKDGDFQVIAITGDTIYIKIKRIIK